MSETSGKTESTTCKEFKKCLEYLHLMLDNEADEDQVNYFTDHIDSCMFCFEQYEVEKHIRELLKTKLSKQPVPSDLAQEIRARVFQSA